MSNFDNCELQEDFWWSQDLQVTKTKKFYGASVDNTAESKKIENTDCGNVKQTEGMTECVTTAKPSVTKTEKVKRPSGAQRRKRKWQRLECVTSSIALNNIQTSFKVLSINELGEQKVVPSFSKTGVQYENLDQRNEQRYINHKVNKDFEQHTSLDYSRNKQFKPLSVHKPSKNCLSKRKYVDNSDQRNVEQTENKKTAYSAALKNKLTAVIIDESSIEGILNPEQSEQIIDKLMTMLSQFTFASDSEVPRFQGYYLSKGILTINCINEISMEWLMNVHLNDLWDGAKIRIMRANQFAKIFRMTAFIPGPIRDNVEILKLLKTQNPELNTSRWRIYHRSQGTTTGMTLVLGVDEKSLEVLRSLEMKPYYGMSRAAFYLPDTKQGSPTRKIALTERHV